MKFIYRCWLVMSLLLATAPLWSILILLLYGNSADSVGGLASGGEYLERVFALFAGVAVAFLLAPVGAAMLKPVLISAEGGRGT